MTLVFKSKKATPPPPTLREGMMTARAEAVKVQEELLCGHPVVTANADRDIHSGSRRILEKPCH